MALLADMREPSTGKNWKCCHASCLGDGKGVTGGHMVVVADLSEDHLLANGWRTDGRHWFCPAHVKLNRDLHATLFDAVTKYRQEVPA